MKSLERIPYLLLGAALLLASRAQASAQAKVKVKSVKAKETTKTVTYKCRGKKTLKVAYTLSPKGIPTAAVATLEKKPTTLAPYGKANRNTVNFAQGDYSLSLDKTKLPVTKAPVMVFKKTPPPSKPTKAAPGKPAAKKAAPVSGGTAILYHNCRPVG